MPVHALELISRYTGASPENAPLHRLGSDQWARARKRAAERARDVAAELLDTYARRAARPGHAFRWPEADYRAFEAGFPFELTEDQATTIEDVRPLQVEVRLGLEREAVAPVNLDVRAGIV